MFASHINHHTHTHTHHAASLSSPSALPPHPIKQRLQHRRLLKPTDAIPPLDGHARHGQDVRLAYPRLLHHGVHVEPGVLAAEAAADFGTLQARDGDGPLREPRLVADVAALLKVPVEEGIDEGGLGAGAAALQGEGDELVGGARGADLAGEAEVDVVLYAEEAEALDAGGGCVVSYGFG